MMVHMSFSNRGTSLGQNSPTRTGECSTDAHTAEHRQKHLLCCCLFSEARVHPLLTAYQKLYGRKKVRSLDHPLYGGGIGIIKNSP